MEENKYTFTADISLCPKCNCSTHTLTNGVCGKCGEVKIDVGLLTANVLNWGRAKELNDPKAQLNKVVEEVGEIAHEISRNIDSGARLEDAIGDTLVTIFVLADILGMSVWDCLQRAYNEIETRKGETVNGTFVKDKENE